MAWRRFYGRKSRSLGDPNDLDVFAHQINPLIRRVEREGQPAQPEEILIEVGSGERIAHRPRFSQIIAEIEALPVGARGELWAAHVDRLSRGEMPDRSKIYEVCQRAAVIIRTARYEYDLNTPEGQALYERHSLDSRSEYDSTCRRMREARAELVTRGEIVTGRAPFGYRWNRNRPEGHIGRFRGRLLVEPGEFALVQQLFREAPHKSAYRLAAESGLLATRVRAILHNPVYTGWPAQHCERHCYRNAGKYGNRRLTREAWVWPEQAGDYPAAVTREQFEQIQERLAYRFSRREKPLVADGWARDVLRFEGTFGPVTLASKQWQGEYIPVYGVQQANHALGAAAARSWINATVEAHILAAFSAPSLLQRALIHHQERQREQSRPGEEDQSAARAELARLRQRLVNLKLAYVDAQDGEEQQAVRKAELQIKGQIEAMKAAIDAAARRSAPAPAFPAVDQILHDEGLIADCWGELSPEEKRAVTRESVSTVLVRTTRRPHPVRWSREIAAVEWNDWLQPFQAGLPLVEVERNMDAFLEQRRA